MRILKSVSFIAVLASCGSAAFAQSADDLVARIDRLQQQLQQTIGQVEELNHKVIVLERQLQASTLKQHSELSPDLTKDPRKDSPKTVLAPALARPEIRNEPSFSAAGMGGGSVEAGAASPPEFTAENQAKLQAGAQTAGVEMIESEPLAPTSGITERTQLYSTVIDSSGREVRVPLYKAPGPQNLGSPNAAALSQDGGFQGQVLVPANSDPSLNNPSVTQKNARDEGVEVAGLMPESAEALYERSNESLLRRQFTTAEAGFRSFLDKYPQHNLAGSAQYWLGETYFTQSDYRQAAQNFLLAYRDYPKSRRAPDSLLKLGISLSKMGQQQQACASFTTIATEFPNAVQVKMRAQRELQRLGC